MKLDIFFLYAPLFYYTIHLLPQCIILYLYNSLECKCSHLASSRKNKMDSCNEAEFYFMRDLKTININNNIEINNWTLLFFILVCIVKNIKDP